MRLFIAKVISSIFNPLILSFPASYLLVYATTHNGTLALKWAVFSFIVALIIATFVILGVAKGVFTDFDVSKQKNRNLLFSLILLLLFFYLIFLFFFNGPKILIITVFAVILSVFIMGVVTYYVKASIHVATVSAFFVILSIAYGGWYILSLIFIPITIWARITTKRHTRFQAWLGAFLGVLLTIIGYLIVRRR